MNKLYTAKIIENGRAVLIRATVLLMLSIIVFFSLSLVSSKSISAAVNQTINFQGKIVNKADGTNLTTGSPACVQAGADTCDFRISIYSDETAGTQYWYEVQSNLEIGDYNGVFSFRIGEECIETQGGSWTTDGDGAGTICGINSGGVDWGNDTSMYIQVEFDADGDGNFTGAEVFSRKLITTVPYAFHAETLNGLSSGDFVQFAPTSAQVTTSTDSLINLETTANTTSPLMVLKENGAGTPDFLNLMQGTETVYSVDNDGYVYSQGTNALEFLWTDRWLESDNNHQQRAHHEVAGASTGAEWFEAGTDSLPYSGGTEYSCSVVFRDRMWLISGGWDYGPRVYSSTDGIDWDLETSSLPDTGRVSHTCVVYKGKIWIIGGSYSSGGTPIKDNVYYSEDGITWHEAGTNSLPVTVEVHTSVVYDEKMWVIGGDQSGSTYGSKVYYSTDGVTWVEAGTNSMPIPLRRHQSVVYDDKMWIIGGLTTGNVRSRKVYYSTDGITWTEAGTNAIPVDKYEHGSTVYDNKMWIIGGQGSSQIYFSTDGSTWTQAGTHAEEVPNVEVFQGKMWIIGGTSSQKVYYSQTGIRGGLDVLDDSGNSLLFVDENGYVGIGDNTPASLFTVGSSDAFQINSSGIVISGQWQATDIGLAHGGTGASLVDPDVDSIFFWDDSASSSDWLQIGSGLSISGNTLSTNLGTSNVTLKSSPEYEGASLTKFYGAGTDTSTTGTLIADSETTSPYNNYYQWESSQGTTQYYTVAVKVTLPSDFNSWQSSNAIQIGYKTADTTAANNSLRYYIYTESGTSVYSNTGGLTSTSWTTSDVAATSLTSWNTAGSSAIIYLRLGASGAGKYTRIGDIKLNYVKNN